MAYGFCAEGSARPLKELCPNSQGQEESPSQLGR